MAAALTGYLMAAQGDPEQLYKVGLGSVRFLLAVGDLVIGWRLILAAQIAQAALDGAAERDHAFYTAARSGGGESTSPRTCCRC